MDFSPAASNNHFPLVDRPAGSFEDILAIYLSDLLAWVFDLTLGGSPGWIFWGYFGNLSLGSHGLGFWSHSRIQLVYSGGGIFGQRVKYYNKSQIENHWHCICGCIEKIKGQQGLHWEYSLARHQLAGIISDSSQALLFLCFPQEEHSCSRTEG